MSKATLQDDLGLRRDGTVGRRKRLGTRLWRMGERVSAQVYAATLNSNTAGSESLDTRKEWAP